MIHIRKKLIDLSMLFTTGVLLTFWYILNHLPVAATPLGVISILLSYFVYKQYRQFKDAKLICDTLILSVPTAIIVNEQDEQKAGMEETIVSTFGILLGDKAYNWGCNGRHGVRLKTIKIDRGTILLAFGCETKETQVRLLHGLTSTEAILDIKYKLWHETGVEADTSNWIQEKRG